MKHVSIIIPNWNGKELLKENVPYVMRALEQYPGKSELIVVDDASSDDSVSFLNTTYPGIKVICLAQNSGFASAVNAGVREAEGEIVYLLNSDVKVKKDFLQPLIRHFQDTDVFAVSSREINSGASGLPLINFRLGMFLHRYRDAAVDNQTMDLLFASGGRSAFDRDKFLSLGGLDEIFSPFYWEDIDICWRAIRQGWVCLWEPDSKVFHDEQSTIKKKCRQKTINRNYWKNHFLFIWKNLSAYLLMVHMLFLPLGMLQGALIRSGVFYGFMRALGQLPEVVRKRRIAMLNPCFPYSDRDILAHYKNLSLAVNGK